MAGVKCSEVFESQNQNIYEAVHVEDLLSEITGVRGDISSIRSLAEANESLHFLVVLANKIMDQAVDNIIEVNFMRMSESMAQQKTEFVERLIEELQQTFGIGNEAMQVAVTNRVEREVQERSAAYEAQKAKRAIGFGRDESSESFHADKGTPQPVGFRPFKEEGEAEPVRKQEIGFSVKSQEKLEKNIRELVEYEEAPAPGGDFSLGFISKAKESGEASVKNSIGFLRTKQESDVIVPSRLHQVLFDLDTGIFEFLKSKE